MTTCARCNRNVTAPIFAGGMAFGSTCYRKVAGTKPRRARKAEPKPADARQIPLDLSGGSHA